MVFIFSFQVSGLPGSFRRLAFLKGHGLFIVYCIPNQTFFQSWKNDLL